MSLPLTQKVTVKGRTNEITDSEEDRGFWKKSMMDDKKSLAKETVIIPERKFTEQF